MDDPVTDIIFVSSQENCPEGYTLVSECPCGHDAQLWEKVLGGTEEERYICYTKEDKGGLVVEDMYIPKRTAQWLYKGYKIIKSTVEGDEPMRHRQLAVKKVQKAEAKIVVADLIVCRGKDNVSKLYKRLEKINGVCICFRRVEYTASSDKQGRHSDQPETSTEGANIDDVSKLAHNVEVLDVEDRRGSKSSEEYYSPTPPPGSSTSPIQDQTSHTSTDSPDYDGPQPVNEVATIKITEMTFSAPPTDNPYHPPASSQPYPTPSAASSQPYPLPSAGSQPYPPSQPYPTPSARSQPYPPPAASSQPYPTPASSHPYPPPPTSSQPYPPPAASSQPYPPPPTSSQPYPPPPTSSQPYPPPSAASSQPYPTAVGGFPSYKLTPAEPQSYHLSYVSQPPTSSYPRPPSSQPGYDTRIGFGVGGGAYPPSQPPLGYSATAGPSFTGTAFSAQQSAGPAPYNPLNPGTTPYPPPSSSSPYPPPATSNQGYGFNF